MTVPFSGVVLEKGTRDPLPNIRVQIFVVPSVAASADAGSPQPDAKADRSKTKGIPATSKEPQSELLTDAQGRFATDDLPPGDYVIRLRGQGLLPNQSVETLTAGRRRSVTYYAARRTNPFEMVVRAEPPEGSWRNFS